MYVEQRTKMYRSNRNHQTQKSRRLCAKVAIDQTIKTKYPCWALARPTGLRWSRQPAYRPHPRLRSWWRTA